jgi:hypothetical protein
MFPDPSGAPTPLPPIALKPQKNDEFEGAADRGRAPSGTESASVKSPEPHWDSVIGAATD